MGVFESDSIALSYLYANIVKINFQRCVLAYTVQYFQTLHIMSMYAHK